MTCFTLLTAMETLEFRTLITSSEQVVHLGGKNKSFSDHLRASFIRPESTIYPSSESDLCSL